MVQNQFKVENNRALANIEHFDQIGHRKRFWRSTGSLIWKEHFVEKGQENISQE